MHSRSSSITSSRSLEESEKNDQDVDAFFSIDISNSSATVSATASLPYNHSFVQSITNDSDSDEDSNWWSAKHLELAGEDAQQQFLKDLRQYKSVFKQIGSRVGIFEFVEEDQVEQTDSTCEHQEMVRVEGYLFVSSQAKQWRERRWVVLDHDKFLCYHSDQHEQSALQFQEFIVTAAKIEEAKRETGKPYSFRIDMVSEIIYCVAMDKLDMDRWMAGLRQNAKCAIIQNALPKKRNSSLDSYEDRKSILHIDSNPNLEDNLEDDNNTVGEIESVEEDEASNKKLRRRTATFTQLEDQPIDLQSPTSLSDCDIAKVDSLLMRHLRNHPDDSTTIIVDHLIMCMNMHGHPLGVSLTDFVHQWTHEQHIEQSEAGSGDPLGKSVEGIRKFREDLVRKCVKHNKEALSSFPWSTPLASRAVDVTLMGELKNLVFMMYKKLYNKEDSLLNEKLKQFITITPAHFGLDEAFWLINCKTDMAAYNMAINKMKDLPELLTATDKVKCILESTKLIVDTLRNHLANAPTISIGADDLLPLMAYVVIKSRITNLYSECRYMEDFIFQTEVSCKPMGSFLVLFRCSLSLLVLLQPYLLDFRALVRSLDSSLLDHPSECASISRRTSESDASEDLPLIGQVAEEDPCEMLPTPAQPAVKQGFFSWFTRAKK